MLITTGGYVRYVIIRISGDKANINLREYLVKTFLK